MRNSSSAMRRRPRTTSSSCRRWWSRALASVGAARARRRQALAPRLAPAMTLNGTIVTDLTDLTLADARDGLRAKRFSATEIARDHIDAVEKARALNAFLVETPERALEMANASDARLARGEAGPLEGVPLGIKDLFCTKDVVSTAGSKILE